VQLSHSRRELHDLGSATLTSSAVFIHARPQRRFPARTFVPQLPDASGTKEGNALLCKSNAKKRKRAPRDVDSGADSKRAACDAAHGEEDGSAAADAGRKELNLNLALLENDDAPLLVPRQQRANPADGAAVAATGSSSSASAVSPQRVKVGCTACLGSHQRHTCGKSKVFAKNAAARACPASESIKLVDSSQRKVSEKGTQRTRLRHLVLCSNLLYYAAGGERASRISASRIGRGGTALSQPFVLCCDRTLHCIVGGDTERALVCVRAKLPRGADATVATAVAKMAMEPKRTDTTMKTGTHVFSIILSSSFRSLIVVIGIRYFDVQRRRSPQVRRQALASAACMTQPSLSMRTSMTKRRQSRSALTRRTFRSTSIGWLGPVNATQVESYNNDAKFGMVLGCAQETTETSRTPSR
jgi:hypothetical protein